MPTLYRPDVLVLLERHGLWPRESTPPAIVYDYLDALYRYELRRLRARLLARELARPAYASEVERIRARYPLLSLPVEQWTCEPGLGVGGSRTGDRESAPQGFSSATSCGGVRKTERKADGQE